jgi:hypothetical protein
VGFLYSPLLQCRSARYPSSCIIRRALETLPSHARVALHFCGIAVPRALAELEDESSLVSLVDSRGGRVQLNFDDTRLPVALDQVWRLLDRYPKTTFIAQENEANRGRSQSISSLDHRNYSVFFDSSGGRGVTCADWPTPLPLPCGYAGGIGPGNLEFELQRIRAAAGQRPIWIDMETKVRRIEATTGADVFDLDAAAACLVIADAFTDETSPAKITAQEVSTT